MDKMPLLDEFEKYLIERGYSQITPSGFPSTTRDYAKVRIPKICEREKISVEQLAANIRHYVEKYGDSGREREFGRKSHNSFISALKRFEEFINRKAL
jgi:site-specific recombinase XerD